MESMKPTHKHFHITPEYISHVPYVCLQIGRKGGGKSSHLGQCLTQLGIQVMANSLIIIISNIKNSLVLEMMLF